MNFRLSLAHIDTESVDLNVRTKSKPMNINHNSAATKPLIPVLIESESGSKFDIKSMVHFLCL